MEARFVSGSMVRDPSFSQKICILCKFSVKKTGIFRPGGGDNPRQTRDRLIHVSIGRFTGFAHFVLFVVQIPTA